MHSSHVPGMNASGGVDDEAFRRLGVAFDTGVLLSNQHLQQLRDWTLEHSRLHADVMAAHSRVTDGIRSGSLRLNHEQNEMLASISPAAALSLSSPIDGMAIAAVPRRHRSTGSYRHVIAAEHRMDAAMAVMDAHIADVHMHVQPPGGLPMVQPTPVVNVTNLIEEQIRRAGGSSAPTAWGVPIASSPTPSPSSPPPSTSPSRVGIGSIGPSPFSWSSGPPVGYITSSTIDEQWKRTIKSVPTPPSPLSGPPGPFKPLPLIDQQLKLAAEAELKKKREASEKDIADKAKAAAALEAEKAERARNERKIKEEKERATRVATAEKEAAAALEVERARREAERKVEEARLVVERERLIAEVSAARRHHARSIARSSSTSSSTSDVAVGAMIRQLLLLRALAELMSSGEEKTTRCITFDDPGWNDPESKGASHTLTNDTSWLPAETATCYSFLPGPGGFRMLSAKRRVRMKRNPFARGGMRAAYFFHDITISGKFVAKQSLDLTENTRDYVVKDIEVQSYAKQFASLFMLEAKQPKNVDFLQPYLYELHRPEAGNANFVFVESYMPGQYVKYTNNGSWVSTKDPSRSMAAFIHFTYQRSNGRMMVTDLQGIQRMLADPQIHSLNDSIGNGGNFGEDGFKNFFQVHHCNEICRYLHLKPHARYRPSSTDSKPGETVPNRKYSNRGLCPCGNVIMVMSEAQFHARCHGRPSYCVDCDATVAWTNCAGCRSRFQYRTRIQSALCLPTIPAYCTKSACSRADPILTTAPLAIAIDF